MRKIYTLLATVFVAFIAHAQTNPAPQPLPYSQDFSSLVSTSTTYPDGWQGWTVSTAPGSTFNTAAPTADRALVASGTANNNGGGVYNYNGKIGFLNTGSLDLSIALALNTTGNSNVQVSYDVMTIRNPYDGTSNTRINEVTLQYRIGTSGAFTTLTGIEYQNNTTAQTTTVTTPQNSQTKTITLPTNCNNQPVVQIRWVSRQVSGAGGRPSFAVDNISVSGNTSSDITPPSLVSLSPANNATNVAQNITATITFDENIAKGTGNIYLKKSSDNSIVQTIDITSAAVTVSGSSASFALSNLIANTSYYINIDNGAFKDLSNNNFAGINNATTWSFTTGNIMFLYDFTNCSSSLSDGFTQQSVVGPGEVWSCTTFGRTGNGVQMNGFNVSNQNDEDWLVSPALNLTATTYPVLSFYSRSKFAGDALRLFVTTNFTGDVTTTTWTELNGNFPAVNSDTWTLSDNIDLSSFKQANVRFAFKYTSNTSASSRWTLDDIAITNSPTAPSPVLSVTTKLLDFREVLFGNTSANKTFGFYATNLSGNITLTAPASYQLSKDGTTFSNSISYTPAEAQNTNTVYVRFAPAAASNSYYGYIQFAASNLNQQSVFVKGNSYPSSTTLNVVNWNLEWFGGPQDPADDNLQQANVKTVMEYLNADVYAVEEVVDTVRFGNMVRSLAGGYNYVVSDFTTSAVDPNDPNFNSNYASGQKLGLIYKTSVVSNVTARGLLKTSAAAYSNWSSGRFPFLVSVRAAKNGQSTNLNFIVLHAKAQSASTAQNDYDRRKGGAKEMKDTLDAYYANNKLIILGDFNDDLDQSIYIPASGPIVSSYTDLISDSTDADSYRSVTLPLSYAGLSSTASNPEMIDHVVISNELANVYAPYTATLYNDIEALTGIANYSTTTTDHYPVMTRYIFSSAAPLPVRLLSFAAIKENDVVKLNWATAEESNTKEFVVERSVDGINYQKIGAVAAAGLKDYQLTDAQPNQNVNYYRLRIVDKDEKSSLSQVVKINFNKAYSFTLSPNPAHDKLSISLPNGNEKLLLQIVDVNGKTVKEMTLTNQFNNILLDDISKGFYLVRLTGNEGSFTEKLVIE